MSEKDTVFTKSKFLYSFLKSFIILSFFFEICYPSIQKKMSSNTKNPYADFGSAYVVTETLENNILVNHHPIKRIFINNKGYLIFQDINDQMTDYKLHIIKEKNQFVITDYDLKQTKIDYIKKDDVLVINFIKHGKEYKLTAAILDHTSLPLLRDDFHWTIDDIK